MKKIHSINDYPMNKEVPYIFILSWNRPIYLWVCLDSIYRHTSTPCKIIIADNNSSDPLVRQVIEGFERRGLFYKVHLFEDNDPFRLKKMVDMYKEELGSYFVFIESDIEILPVENGCWLERFLLYMDANPNLACVGSWVYQKDFVSMEDAKRLYPDVDEEQLAFLIKINALMRQHNQEESKYYLLIDPHNAPLRLLMFRKSAYDRVPFGQDFQFYERFKALNYDAMISTEVVHRHLSLLNIFDYSAYSGQDRNTFFDEQL